MSRLLAGARALAGPSRAAAVAWSDRATFATPPVLRPRCPVTTNREDLRASAKSTHRTSGRWHPPCRRYHRADNSAARLYRGDGTTVQDQILGRRRASSRRTGHGRDLPPPSARAQSPRPQRARLARTWIGGDLDIEEGVDYGLAAAEDLRELRLNRRDRVLPAAAVPRLGALRVRRAANRTREARLSGRRARSRRRDLRNCLPPRHARGLLRARARANPRPIPAVITSRQRIPETRRSCASSTESAPGLSFDPANAPRSRLRMGNPDDPRRARVRRQLGGVTSSGSQRKRDQAQDPRGGNRGPVRRPALRLA